MKKTLIISTMLFAVASAYAQRQQKIDIELLGSTNLVGIHFEQPLGESSPFAVRAGLSYGYAEGSGMAVMSNNDQWNFVGYDQKEHQIAVPVEVNFLTGLEKRNHLEVGLGTSLGNYNVKFDLGNQTTSVNSFGYFCFANLGWRHDFKKRTTLRLGLTATFDLGGEKAVKRNSTIVPYVSFGVRL